MPMKKDSETPVTVLPDSIHVTVTRVDRQTSSPQRQRVMYAYRKCE
jgi:hypothetical protein